MRWDFFSTKSESVTIVRERTRTIKIEITETYRETVTRRIDSSLYATPQIDLNVQRYLASKNPVIDLEQYLHPKKKWWEERYEHNYLLPEKKEEKKDAFDEFFDWLFS
ncbi:hypothetical protein MYX82_02770 [Acidobacteria bacterium AH-259-D05]|nr:hypothetical protein [Acidobacteria bacterium AH-259-D05]